MKKTTMSESIISEAERTAYWDARMWAFFATIDAEDFARGMTKRDQMLVLENHRYVIDACCDAWNGLSKFFEGDAEKIHAWLSTPNPGIGGISPMEMCWVGRIMKLAEWMNGCFKENKPPDGSQ